MNIKQLNWLIIINGFVGMLLLSMFFFCIREYRSLAHSVDEIVQLKQEYDTVILMFKRAILESSSHDTESEKKKDSTADIVIDQADSLLLLNRDPSYLQKKAREFARQHHLESEVSHLYTTESIAQTKKKTYRTKRSTRQSKKRKRNLYQNHPMRQDLEAVKSEIAIAWPIDKGLYWISYGFGPRKHPSGRWEFHKGIDLAAPIGTPVRAAADGIVLEACNSGGYGNMVLIGHTTKVSTRYAHLSKILVRVGDQIVQGDILGKVGATGNVRGKNGAHLHFEVAVYGKRVNPFYFLS